MQLSNYDFICVSCETSPSDFIKYCRVFSGTPIFSCCSIEPVTVGPYWTPRKKSLELIGLFSISKVSLVQFRFCRVLQQPRTNNCDPYQTNREKSLEMVEPYNINKVCLFIPRRQNDFTLCNMWRGCSMFYRMQNRRSR